MNTVLSERLLRSFVSRMRNACWETPPGSDEILVQREDLLLLLDILADAHVQVATAIRNDRDKMGKS